MKRTRENPAEGEYVPGYCVLPNEDQEEFNAAERAHLDFWKPATSFERTLVADIAMYDWLRVRAMRMQEAIMDGDGSGMKSMAFLLRYQSTNEQAMREATGMLIDVRRNKQLAENGYVMPKVSKTDSQHPEDQNPWLRTGLDPAHHCGWVNEVTGKFTSFADGFATEVADEEARERDRERERLLKLRDDPGS